MCVGTEKRECSGYSPSVSFSRPVITMVFSDMERCSSVGEERICFDSPPKIRSQFCHQQDLQQKVESNSVSPNAHSVPMVTLSADAGRSVRKVPMTNAVTSPVAVVSTSATEMTPALMDHNGINKLSESRPGTYPSHQYSPHGSYHPHYHQWLARQQHPHSHLHHPYSIHPARRALFHTYPTFRHPMIHSSAQRKARGPGGAMDYVPSPESFYGSDLGKTAFAASPNSLYMYDQERTDMQTTLGNDMYGSVCQTVRDGACSVGAEPDFDLNPRYEISNLDYFGGLLQADACDAGNISDSSLGFETAAKAGSLLGLLQSGNGQPGLKMGSSGPTLAELNMSNVDPYLLEDIESFLSSEEEDKPPVSDAGKALGGGTRQSAAQAGSSAVKTEGSPKRAAYGLYASPSNATSTSSSSAALPHQNRQPAASQLGLTAAPVSNLCSVRTPGHNVAVVPPICGGGQATATTVTTTTTTTTHIKAEPMDTYDETSSGSCLHKMLSAPAQRPAPPSQSPAAAQAGSPPERLVMTVVGQTRAPPLRQQVKSESVEEKWKEIEKFIHDPEQAAASRKRKRYASGDSSIDGDMYGPLGSGSYSDDDSDSDADSDYSDSPLEESLTELARKSKQYFWQYNVQAKGPKGTRLKLRIHDDDPHHPSNFEDPVFDAGSTSLVGIRHGGKARKGDGNEVTPNPKKLFQIGKLLYKLNKQINSFQMSNDLPASVRNKSRKEKNKLASRACRLKKKAQHEANKIKLTGLDTEQGELLDVISLIWPQLKERAQEHIKGLPPFPGSSETLTACLEALVTTHRKTIIAGNTTDYVNEVIARVEEGDITGGLAIRNTSKTVK